MSERCGADISPGDARANSAGSLGQCEQRMGEEIRSMTMHEANVLGVDIGGVIIDRVSEDGQSYAEAAAIEGAFEAIARLAQQRFHEHVWLVSRCEESREPVLMTWLEQHNFFDSARVPRSHVRFCRQRNDKATICQQLGVTHFIDDRLEVLSHLVGSVPYLYLLQSRAEGIEGIARFRQFLPHVHLVTGWGEIVDAVLSLR
jgi:hypothetical protein